MTIVGRGPESGADAGHADVSGWVEQFSSALRSRDPDALAALFAADAHWRDLLAFTWDFTTASGPAAIGDRLASSSDEAQPRGVRNSDEHTAPRELIRNGRPCVDVFLRFETAVGEGAALVRLVEDAAAPSGLSAWLALTQLVELDGRPRLTGPRARERRFEAVDPRRNWADVRTAEAAFDAREPEVLVVGGGHAGLFAAAHLRRLGVDVLVVERNARLGDNWRRRYRSLTLHNTTDMNQFPYLPFPDSFPEYLPRDQIANWIEHYADILDIPTWTSTALEDAVYDEGSGRWAATVTRVDGAQRVLRPRHIISATGGFGGSPRIPHLKGIEDFAGEVLHAEALRTGPQHAGRRMLVIGSAASAHDVALELSRDGAEVTMLQRGTTTVVSLESANVNWSVYSDGTPLAEADMSGQLSFIHQIFIDTCRRGEAADRERDAEMRAALEAAGLRLDTGEDDTGWRMKFWSRGGGYYFDQGCAEAIVSGRISILDAARLERFVPAGARVDDGTTLPFDGVVFATGYENRQVENAALFGDEVAERVGPIGGFDESDEIRNAFRVTPQPGLWFMFGGILTARQYSALVALQIAADLDGRIPPHDRVRAARRARERATTNATG